MDEISDSIVRCRPVSRVCPLLVGLIAVGLLSTSGVRTALAQVGFQIVWVMIGEAATGSEKGAERVGRQLFLASELMSLSLGNTKVERVDVEPVILEIGVGEQLCLTALTMRAYGPDRQPIGGAPLAVSIRQDHKERLSLKRSKRDICMRPAEEGEYPIRLTSLLPAPDGTMRGAQVFLRAKNLSGNTRSAHSN